MRGRGRKERREQNTEGQRKGGGRKGKVSGLGKKGRRKQGEYRIYEGGERC